MKQEKNKASMIWLLGLLGVLAIAPLARAQQQQPADFDAWAEGVAVERMRAEPTGSTFRQYLPPAEQQLLDRQLTPNTPAYRAERIAVARTNLQQLERFERARLTPQQRSSAAVIEWSLRGAIEAEPFADYEFVFNQFRGLHVNLVNFLSQAHPIRNAQDIDNYLARLGQVADRMDSGIARAKDAAGRGFLMPRFITEASLGQFERFLADVPARNVLVVSLEQRAARLSTVTPEARAQAVAAAEKIVAESIIPAFRRAQALLQEQLPRSGMDAGLWRLPGGDKAYAYELRRNTTTDYLPEQIHRLGLAEVARIEGQMDTLLRRLGYRDGSVKDRYEKLEADLQPKGEGDPRPALLARFDTLLRDAEQRARLLFDITPKAPLVVRREPLFTEKTAAAHYSSPAKDGSLPGIFWAPLPGPGYRIADMRTLAYHEGVPGHHFQIALQQETTSLPRYRRDGVFAGGSAFAEGWALYAEQLAAESGWYEEKVGEPAADKGPDIAGRLGQLSAELFRARRLVVDTGLHAMKWTRQQAIDYGIPAHEVDRYVVNPGQACAYKIGQLHILALRGKAQQALGERFSLKAFHSLLLQTGNVPLAVLSQVVDEWVARQAKT
ncbi:DUF885 domain-containing protein [Roseateles violae]|uniref:DUF885 domain-containing protein n=1 Tax=Roseateles violae TaxID=3058042 RepID=A0ABT8DLK4_9BURK|nr:DUF885 domain-containing protein [Pelomonas sp. PFR6]MDN3919285.1 DUF885 domain-containing protein [Pelomonas sp. PFR6]